MAMAGSRTTRDRSHSPTFTPPLHPCTAWTVRQVCHACANCMDACVLRAVLACARCVQYKQRV
eukprot:11111510-Alexandrium_andersonii.AAC.1